MKTKQTILLVDDDENILEFLSYNLQRDGYEVKKATNGPDAIIIAIKEHPDLIVLDVMMPEMDGIEVCRIIRENDQLVETRIAFLTARGEDYSQIAGFEAGGDDYIVKPISPKVFVSKVKAILSRSIARTDTNTGILKIANLNIDTEKFILFKDGHEIILPYKVFKILFLLASKPNKVFTRREIFDNIWGYETYVGERTIDVHIRKLREKTGIENIKTVKGLGYKFELK